jgi:hypothetical protein
VAEGDIVTGKITIDDDPKNKDERTFLVNRENDCTYLFKSRKRITKISGIDGN